MSKTNLLKEAIAEAKTIKEVAIANAKIALEEAFTPYLKEKLSLKLEAMDNENEEIDETVVNETEEAEETIDETEVTETEETVEEGEFSLDELLAELEEGNEENLNENEEIVAEKKEKEEKEEEEEEVSIEDMTQEDLEGLIIDIIKDMVASGELEASEEAAEGENEESEEEIEIEDENDGTEPLEESENITEGAWDKIKGVVSGVAKAANMFKQPAEFVKEMDAALKENPTLKDDEQFMSTYNFLKGLSTASKASATSNVNRPMEETAQLAEAMNTIKKLSNDLNEINVLNSKLLYTNKIFRANTLNENQKIKVLSSFDKAKTKKEVELIYETIKGDFTKKTPLKESYLGSASKSIANQITTTSKTSPIVSDGAFARMQELAGIKKNN